MQTKPISHFVAGAFIGVIYIIMFTIYYYKGLSFKQNNWIVFSPYLVSLVLIIFAVVLHGKSKNNHVTFGGLFNYGFKTTAVFVLLISAFIFFFLKYSDYKEQFEAAMASQIKKESDLSNQSKEMAMNLKGSFTTLIIGAAIFTNVIVGAIGSLLAATFARKDDTSSPDKQL